MFGLSIRQVAVLLALLLRVHAQGIEAVEQCGQDCINGSKAKFPTFGCDSNSESCLCANPNFFNSIRDCAVQACGEAVVAQATNYAIALCATATLAPASTPTPEVSTGSPPPPPPSTTEPPPPPPPPATTSTTSTPPPPTETPTQEASTSTTQPAQTPPAPATTTSTTGAQTSTHSSSATSSSATVAAKPVSTDDSDSAASGLSGGAKAGIGIGVSAVVIAAAAVGICFFLRRRRGTKPKTSAFAISGPIGGRDYGSDHDDYAYDNKTTDLEMRSHRYEDMLPRQQPTSII